MRNLPAPVALAALAVLAVSATRADEPKKAVSSEADLPRHSYPIDRPASALVQADDAIFAPLVSKASADVGEELKDFDIKDRSTLRDLQSRRIDQLELEGDYPGALAAVEAFRETQDKPAAKLTAALGERAWLKAAIESGGFGAPGFDEKFSAIYAEEVNPLPWDLVQDWAKGGYAATKLASSAARLAYVMTLLDHSTEHGGSLNDAQAAMLLGTRTSLKFRMRIAPLQAKVLGAYIQAHMAPKPDIWPDREVTLTPDQVKAPVLVAIWDSGIDVAQFPVQTFTDPQPSASGTHGIAFADDGSPSQDWTNPLTAEQQAGYAEVRDEIVGRQDIQEFKDTPEAAKLEREMKSFTPEQLHRIQEIGIVVDHYMHGTHCAGIAARGNPGIRLVVARFNDGLPYLPFPPTGEWARRMGADFQQMADYFRTRHVRVVNMSWGDDIEEFELWLSKTSGGADPVARKKKATELYQIWYDAVQTAIKSAPDTLFICAAGNSDSNTGFTGDVPSSFKLPNLIAVGAVNQAGEETSFTSYGDSVLVHADGFDVLSTVPGGAKVRLSGTSMASPNVVNLAAKLFALDPSLSPTQVIELIRKGATDSADGRLHLIDEKRSVALLLPSK